MLRLGPNHLQGYLFKHIFQDTLNLLCDCGKGVESFTHFLLQGPLFLNKRYTLMSNLNKIDPQISKFNFSNLTNTLLFGNSFFSAKMNIPVLDTTIDYILSAKRFDNLFSK